MADYTFERLSAQDAGFLWAETPNQPMHVGAVALFESDTMQSEHGGIDIDRYRAQVESILHWIPRYRQKIEWTPVERWPVWVDDRSFDLGHHIRHIALPAPGTQAQLKELVGRINARRLDRRHALWECWLIEGIDQGSQFAILNKIHHCMIDGAAGADLSQILMSPSPRYEERPSVPYLPRPMPRKSDLVADAIGRSVSRPLAVSRKLIRGWVDSASGRDAPSEAEEPLMADRLRAFGKLAENALAPASPTPINGELGPRRRFEWLTMPLDDVRELRRELGCTINDVVLATVAGAVRRYLFRRRLDVRKLDFRISAPVSMRRPEHDRIQGNHVSSWIVRLPLESEDALDRVMGIRAQTEALKSDGAALAIDSILQMAEWIPGPVLERALPAVSSSGPVNMIVTNVPGPQFPLYLAGTKLLAMYPIVPLVPGGGLGVALFSYEGKLCWGFNADDELVPDLDMLVGDVHDSFEELRGAVVERFMSRRTASSAEPEATRAAPESVEPKPTASATRSVDPESTPSPTRSVDSESTPSAPKSVEKEPSARAAAAEPPKKTGPGVQSGAPEPTPPPTPPHAVSA